MLFGGFVSSLLLIAAFILSLMARKHIKELAARLTHAEHTDHVAVQCGGTTSLPELRQIGSNPPRNVLDASALC